MSTATTIFTGAVALSALSYIFYFDYQRRHSPEFRRDIRRKNQEFDAEKTREFKKAEQRQRALIAGLIEKSLQEDPIPEGLEACEQFFLAEISRAETLISSKNGNPMLAALAFYRGLAAYPNPIELLTMYEKSIPRPVLELVRLMVGVCPPPAIASALRSEMAAASVE